MKYLMMALVALVMAGCATHEASIDCVDCNSHLENGATTIDCNTCTFKYDGKLREGDVINLPTLPDRV